MFATRLPEAWLPKQRGLTILPLHCLSRDHFMSLETFLASIRRTDPWADTSRFLIDEQNFFSNRYAFDILIRTLSPSVIIEVGSWKGHSANAMADICKANKLDTRILCVDTWLGSREHWLKANYLEELHLQNGRPTLYERFMGNVHARGNSDVVTPLPLPSRTAATVLGRHNVKADLIYIDGAHEYWDVMDDLVSYYPLLSSGGLMFGDDFVKQIAAAVMEFADMRKKRVIVNAGRKWLLADSDDQMPGFVPAQEIDRAMPVTAK